MTVNRRSVRTVAVAALVVATALVLSGCGQGLLFRETVTITLLNPTEGSVQTLPMTVRWTPVDGVEKPASYGVFIDTSPPAPGETVDPELLQAEVKQVFVTTSLEQVVEEITRKDTVIESEKDEHEVTVVGLDSAGRRIDESSAFTRFRVAR